MAAEGRRPLVAIDARGYFTGGGVGRYARNLLREVVSAASRQVDLRLLISNRHIPAELELPRAPGVEVIVSRADWMDGAKERRWLDREVADADLVHVLSGHWVATHVPSIVTLHDLTPLVRPRLVGAEARQTARRVVAALVRASRVIAVSETTAQDARRVLGWQIPPIAVVHHAAAPAFRPGVECDGVLWRYGVAADEFTLAVSALNPHKNLAQLVAAYAASAVTRPLLIAGAHREAAAEVHDAVVRHGLMGRVRLVGRVSDEDLAALYAGCRTFVFPSLYEGFGLPPLEAMACGAAVIAAHAGSIPEVVGDAAVLVDPFSTASLAAALRRVDADAALRKDLRRRSVAHAATFSWARAATATLAIYGATIRACGPRGAARDGMEQGRAA